MSYDFKTIEERWCKIFKEEKVFKKDKDSNKTPFYCLEMFPYPSGNIHMGHVRNYSIGDVVARFKRLNGFNVLHPMGWDAFGLPAENAAIEHQISPYKWIQKNITDMKKQFEKMGFSYHWEDEISTADSDYYRWGQWFFTKMYGRGLVYRKKASVNWDPVDKTVLANEQVIDGKGWRSGVLIEKKVISQWFFRITKYQEELLEGLSQLEGDWPETVLTMQRNWIGKSEGVLITFKHGDIDFPIFTTRPDTLYGVTYVAIAFDHKNLETYIKKSDRYNEIKSFIKKCSQINQNIFYKKEGIFTGVFITHPLTKQKLPLYIANFVLASYGTGAIMCVPAHDQRDFEFAKAYDLAIKMVIQNKEKTIQESSLKEAYEKKGVLVNSGLFTGLSSQEAILKITSYLEKQKIGKRKTQYKLKDWLISRQRYWGNPIPIVYDENNQPISLDEKNLPVILPKDIGFDAGSIQSLKSLESFKKMKFKDGKKVIRETETMDTFTCSSWYFMRFMDPHNSQCPFSKEASNYWKQVDLYIGGIEHACLHLLYARFFYKVMRDMNLAVCNEPFKKLLTQGMVCNYSYYRVNDKGNKIYYYADEVSLKKNNKGEITGAFLKKNQKKVMIGRLEKMSKSKKNGVFPEEIIKLYGADSVRLFILFASPVERNLEWNIQGLEGCYRFLNKLWRWYEGLVFLIVKKKESDFSQGAFSEETLNIRRNFHKMLKKVTEDINKRYQFNTAIASMMSFLNETCNFIPKTKEDKNFFKEMLRDFLIVLSPFAPFIAEEIFLMMQFEGRVYNATWPKYNLSYLQESEQTIIIQVNGKLRARVIIPLNSTQEFVIQKAKEEKILTKWFEEKKIVKEIYIPNKLVNFVVK